MSRPLGVVAGRCVGEASHRKRVHLRHHTQQRPSRCRPRPNRSLSEFLGVDLCRVDRRQVGARPRLGDDQPSQHQGRSRASPDPRTGRRSELVVSRLRLPRCGIRRLEPPSGRVPAPSGLRRRRLPRFHVTQRSLRVRTAAHFGSHRGQSEPPARALGRSHRQGGG